MKWHKEFPQIKNIESESMNETNTKKQPWSRQKRAMIMFVGFGMLLVLFAAVAIVR
jgi:hypothetical protein